jgi:hypothetical protein
MHVPKYRDMLWFGIVGNHIFNHDCHYLNHNPNNGLINQSIISFEIIFLRISNSSEIDK